MTIYVLCSFLSNSKKIVYNLHLLAEIKLKWTKNKKRCSVCKPKIQGKKGSYSCLNKSILIFYLYFRMTSKIYK